MPSTPRELPDPGARSTPPGDLCVEVMNVLSSYREQATWREWNHCALEFVRRHSIFPVLHRDPFSSYSFRRPRRYAGDAVLMDFIYGGGQSGPLVEAADEFGRELYRQVSQCHSFSAMSARRDDLAGRIADCCAAGPSRILALGCGHLRELRNLPGDCRPNRFVALDQDELSLAAAQADLAGIPIEPIQASAFRLLHAGYDLGVFDFIYAAGLYDQLDDAFAAGLLVALANRLAPGGRLLVDNVMPGFPAAAYMEAVMDWWLIYRTEAEMKALGRVAAEAGGFVMRTFTDDWGAIVNLEIRREP